MALIASTGAAPAGPNQKHEDLVALFQEWRRLEAPPWVDGAPDYTEKTTQRRYAQLKALQARLAAFKVDQWPVAEQVDYHLVRAEMNGMDFNVRVLRPWTRDPAFYQSIWTYQSDTPAHEGPTHHALVELWTYSFPLSEKEAARLARELGGIPPLLEQARKNLTGDARDLWLAGTETLRQQSRDLSRLSGQVGDEATLLTQRVRVAKKATDAFVTWLEKEAPQKTGSSGVGRANYTWYLRNVHLVPMTWQDEVVLMKRELARAHASLRLERQRNRGRPSLAAVANADAYKEKAEAAIERYLEFLGSTRVLDVKPYMAPALRAHMGQYVPASQRNFFARAMHYDPTLLYTHFYHWWDLARMEKEPHPSPVRRGPLLYNIFDSRAEGLATAMEEIYLQVGGYDERPRVREVVWIMLAQRAARGLASLYAHANEISMKEAADLHVKRTPDEWMRRDLSLLGFEQQLYLRQPGYGTSYVTGKYLIERLMAERAERLKDEFSTARFFTEIDSHGVIPVALLHWQMVGLDDDVRSVLVTERPPWEG